MNDFAPKKHALRCVKIIREFYGLRKNTFFGLDAVSPLSGYQVEEFIAGRDPTVADPPSEASGGGAPSCGTGDGATPAEALAMLLVALCVVAATVRHEPQRA